MDNINKIEQKRGIELRNYCIIDDGLKAEIKTHEGYQSSLIKFEEIGFDEYIFERKPHPLEVGLFISVFFNVLLLSVLGIQWLNETQINYTGISSGLFAAVVGVGTIWSISLFKSSKVKVLKGQKSIYFFYDNKQKLEVDAFIEVLKAKRKHYFRSKYMVQEEFISLEAYEYNIKWLLQMKYIDIEEYKNIQEGIDLKRITKM